VAALLALAAGMSLAAHRQAASPAPVFTPSDLMASVRVLADAEMNGRRTGSVGNGRARQWILSQFDAAGLRPMSVSFEHPFQFEAHEPAHGAHKSQTGVNLMGLCRGTGAADDGVIVISAHYDHLGVRDGAVYFGADDNASGVSVLVALARQCQRSPWRHETLFVAFDAEELGLHGARAFVANPPLSRERIAVNVNLDMVARGDKGEIFAAGTAHTPELRRVLAPVAARAPVKLLFGHDTGGGREDWTTQSDHAAFHAAAIPFVYFGVEDHPDYHRPTDTPEKIDPAFFFNAANTILDAVSALDRALPLTRR
jgi:hypothetical protein